MNRPGCRALAGPIACQYKTAASTRLKDKRAAYSCQNCALTFLERLLAIAIPLEETEEKMKRWRMKRRRMKLRK